MEEEARAGRRLAHVVDMTVISLLVDKGLLTREEVADRLVSLADALTPDLVNAGVRQAAHAIADSVRTPAASRPRWTPQVIEGGAE